MDKHSDYGMTGIVRLAYVGIAAIVALVVLVPVGVLALIWWAWRHLSVTIR